MDGTALLAIDGAARQLVCDEAKAALFAKPEDASAIAQALTLLSDDPSRRAEPGANGLMWVIANATRETLAAKYLEHLDGTIKKRAPVAKVIDRALTRP